MSPTPPTSTPPPKRSTHNVKLPSDFVPSRYAVICGRGKLCSASPGNKYLRDLINMYLTPYSMAKNKAKKSAIVSAIIHIVREISPNGAFVKEEENGSAWWEVDESFAREKIGCIFRDLLHAQYRSSTKAKQARKKATMGAVEMKEGKKKSGIDCTTGMQIYNGEEIAPGPHARSSADHYDEGGSHFSSFSRVNMKHCEDTSAIGASDTTCRTTLLPPLTTTSSSRGPSCFWTRSVHCQEAEDALPKEPRYPTYMSEEESLAAAKQRKRLITRVVEEAWQTVNRDTDLFDFEDDELPDDLSGIFD